MEKATARKRLFVYLALVFAITFLLEFLVVVPFAGGTDLRLSSLATAVVAAVMLIPALSVILTRVITKEGFKDMWIRPNLKKRWGYYVIAWFAPTLFIVIGALAYFLIFPEHYDASLTALRLVYEASGVAFPEEQAGAFLAVQLAQSALLAPALNLIACMGEELGWRGYMMPKLIKSGVKVVPAALIGGVIWGLWHAPLTWGIGHNYGMGYAGYPWLGIGAMCVFCVVCGSLFTWLSFRTRSCIPAALAHGALNGAASAGIYFTRPEVYNPFVGPAPTGVIGGAAFIVAGVVAIILMKRDEKRGELIYEPEVSTPSEPEPPAEPVAMPAGFTKETFNNDGE